MAHSLTMPIAHRDKLAGLWLHEDVERGRTWAVAMVHTGGEIEVTLRLGTMGLEAFCPTLKRCIRPVRKRKAYEKTIARLAGYIFVDVTTITNLEEIYRVPKFHCFLRPADKWALVADEIIQALLDLEARGMFEPSSVRAQTVFKIGDKVRVREGPFGGLRGEAAAIIGGRVMVMEGDFTKPVEFPAEHLEAEKA